jgi:autoinducer 2-degrading protein
MPRLAIVGTIDIVPGYNDQFLALLMAHKARCLKDEPGTLQLEILLPREDDTEVLVCEVYRDDAAFDAHRSGSSFARWREETAGNGRGNRRNKVHSPGLIDSVRAARTQRDAS